MAQKGPSWWRVIVVRTVEAQFSTSEEIFRDTKETKEEGSPWWPANHGAHNKKKNKEISLLY